MSTPADVATMEAYLKWRNHLMYHTNSDPSRVAKLIGHELTSGETIDNFIKYIEPHKEFMSYESID